ncbi:hypothetical protein VFPFJ_06213 [Purpureocillium lilacinum]|uniref:Uncharacterized protein n=1 Tax=Purpureocillium lilacinum TaxID=33203 RepID=A0A179HK00_PURLI|nr:hypothetical protein VFPFJ_06213 [Purpureocillium lilacinum]OAQ67385.1 hypothetical protein VFPBJ_10980 [Purpureocillium lilacinum]OAQ89799.1 hypothetical protein VFPFJ_06213 [Purpureocillium lilacinum]
MVGFRWDVQRDRGASATDKIELSPGLRVRCGSPADNWRLTVLYRLYHCAAARATRRMPGAPSRHVRQVAAHVAVAAGGSLS